MEIRSNLKLKMEKMEKKNWGKSSQTNLGQIHREKMRKGIIFLFFYF